MRSHGRHKRSKSNKDADNEMYMNMQVEDDLHPDNYSRSRNSAEHYRTASRSSRVTYSSDRDRAPHSHRDDDWHRAAYDHDRYTYGDLYSRGGGDRLDDYDDGRRGDSVSWRGVDPNPYPPGHDWSHHYEHAGTSSYPEPSSLWAVPPPVYEGSRSSYVGHWQERDSRDLPADDWEPTGLRGDHTHDRRQEWRPEGRREKISQPKFQSESNWGRRRESDWNREVTTQNDFSMDERQDRAWEPAASWKSSNRDNQQHHQPQRTQNGHRHNGKSKRNHTQNKQRREWRQADDGDLNNWKRREPSRSGKATINQHPPPKRKHGRSPSRSRSRSRSPTVSYRSHRSSRGRSRSLSFSPASKRRRRDDSSPVTLRSRTPSEKGIHHPKHHRHYSQSPSPPGRRGSISQGSSSGSDRSLSRSPIGRPRSLHRLPTVTPASGVANSGKTTRNGTSNRKGEESRNGQSRLYQRDRTRRGSRSSFDVEQEEQAERSYKPSTFPSASISAQYSEQLTDPISISMPPPSLPPSHSFRGVSSPEGLPAPRSRIADPRVNAAPPKQNHVTSMKGAGFKPIGKASSSIKKFFPADEEDMDYSSEEQDHYSVGNAQAQPLSSSREASDFSWMNGEDHIPKGAHCSRDFAFEPKQKYQDKPVEPLQSDMSPEHAACRAALVESASATSVKDIIEGRVSPRDGIEKALSIVDPPFSPTDNQDIPTDILSASSHKDLYRIVNQVGEGTFGKVYKAQNTLSGGHVALKRIRMESEKDGFPVTAMREIKLLQSLRHENVVRLYEMMVSRGSVFMVFEYMDHDLTGILSQSQFVFSDSHLKSLCYQMFAGLAYLHHKGVIHRDIKGSNILVNNRGELKLADFGLARFYQKRRRADYTNRVITLWYRPPELLFGATVYGPEVDIWSAGCIMLELSTKKPIFQGNDEIHQVEVLFKLLGTPTPERWPDVMNLPWYELVKPQQVMPNRFREAFHKWLSPAGLDLAEQLLTYDPSKRISAWHAMETPYFIREAPAAAKPVGLVELEGEWHELETKRERAKRKERRNQT